MVQHCEPYQWLLAGGGEPRRLGEDHFYYSLWLIQVQGDAFGNCATFQRLMDMVSYSRSPRVPRYYAGMPIALWLETLYIAKMIAIRPRTVQSLPHSVATINFLCGDDSFRHACMTLGWDS